MNLISNGGLHHAQKLQQICPDIFTTLNEDPTKCDANYIFGLFDQEYNKLQESIKAGKDTYIYFIGSDIIRCLMENPERIQYIKEHRYDIRGIATQSIWQKQMLYDRAYILPKVVTQGPAELYKITPYPKQPTYSFYYGRHPGPYDLNHFLYYAIHYPQINFIIYGLNAEIQGLTNMTNVECVYWGEESIESIINRSTGLLRLTAWDGFSSSVIEFASSGRHIVSNIPYPLKAHPNLDIHNHKTPDYILADYYIHRYGPSNTWEHIKRFIH